MTVRLGYVERQRIELWLRERLSRREIARRLGRHHSDIDDEYARNMDQGFLPYNARRAQMRAEGRAHHGRKRKLDKDSELKEFVVEKLMKDWSPEQIAGRLNKQPPPNLIGRSITFETIYQFVYSLESGSDGQLLYKHLRKGQPKRTGHYGRRSSNIKIPDRVSIHDRPALVGHGHWETDTLFGRKNQPASVQYEKSSQLVRLHKLVDQTAVATREAIADSLESLPTSWRQSLTFDNGTENYEHNQLGIPTFFCDPYSAWQKGGVENMNGLIRQYIPKRADLTQYTDQDIHQIQERLNNRPRKGLNYRTPNEIFQKVAG
ncbi:MAG: IS30 family transposase [Candidatus Berkelbacteria bacterium]|nr:IS30 family transposase [Candidatus Berkelbacteria bacterium]